MRRPRVGVAVSGDLAVAVVRTGRIISAPVELVRPAETGWAEFVATLFDQLSVRRRGGEVTMVIDPPRARSKQLFGVPATLEATEVCALLARAPEAFFVAQPDSLVTSDARMIDGAWWGAAADRDFIVTVGAACAAFGLNLVGVTPEDSFPTARDPLSRAIAVLDATDSTPLLIDVERRQRMQGRARRTRLLLLSALALTLTGALAATGAVYRARTGALLREAERERIGIAATAASRTFAATTLTLFAEARAISGDRESSAVLLSRLAKALPESAAIVSLSIDSAAITISVLAPQEVDVVRALGRVDGLDAPTLVGALSLESIRGDVLQRTTLSMTVRRRLPKVPALTVNR